MNYEGIRAMFEGYSRNKYTSTGVVQWMLNNAWPSMIWHLYDYYLDADAGYFAAKKACEPLHIQYSYDDRSIVVVNSTYQAIVGLQASVKVHGLKWNEIYSTKLTVNSAADSSQRIISIPENLYLGPERIFFIDLTLSDSTGRLVSHNFYWVPGTLTTFDWNKTDYTHTPASRHEDLAALASLPKAQVEASAEIDGRKICLHLKNASDALAFQIRAAARTPNGGLIAPVFWSDNWVELTPGESTELTAELPEGLTDRAVIQLDGWNIAPATISPKAPAVAH
jgi:exo-1,4-beta-D-glucosaminidase